jgi:hypothetical protein
MFPEDGVRYTMLRGLVTKGRYLKCHGKVGMADVSGLGVYS